MKYIFTFEELREKLENLPQPLYIDDRSIYWIYNRRLGLAKTDAGRIEIFVVGERILPKTHTLRRHLEHGCWAIADSDDRLNANRIILPAGTHFLSVAALIAIELIRAKIGGDRPLQQVIDQVEPFLEMALRHNALDDEYIVGLMGELLCLETLLDATVTSPQNRMAVLDMWQGYQIGQRDFSMGEFGIEIKTTYLETSTHKITGLHQIELNESADSRERNLLLLSIGLSQSEHEGQTLPDLVQRIFSRLANTNKKEDCSSIGALQSRFLQDVAKYGSKNSVGYDHQTMGTLKAYSVRYRNTFTPRLYNMLDHEILILRKRDLIGKHLKPNDIQYRIDLPTVINGMNPAGNWRQQLIAHAKISLGI